MNNVVHITKNCHLHFVSTLFFMLDSFYKRKLTCTNLYHVNYFTAYQRFAMTFVIINITNCIIQLHHQVSYIIMRASCNVYKGCNRSNTSNRPDNKRSNNNNTSDPTTMDPTKQWIIQHKASNSKRSNHRSNQKRFNKKSNTSNMLDASNILNILDVSNISNMFNMSDISNMKLDRSEVDVRSRPWVAGLTPAVSMFGNIIDSALRCRSKLHRRDVVGVIFQKVTW